MAEPTGSPAIKLLECNADAAVLYVRRKLVSGESVVCTEPVLGSVDIPGLSDVREVRVLRLGESDRLREFPPQDLFALGFPVGMQFGKTPTTSKGGFAGRMSDESGPWLKYEGLISGGHSGGPTVTAGGVVIGWNTRNLILMKPTEGGRSIDGTRFTYAAYGTSGLNHVRPIEYAKNCIEAALSNPSLQPNAEGTEGKAVSWSDLFAPATPAILPHTMSLSQESATLFGREEDEQRLQACLCDARVKAKYFLVMGPAGNGKTELVLSVMRRLVQRGPSPANAPASSTATDERFFSAVIFVELRGLFSANDVEQRVRQAVDELQGLPSGVLDVPAQRAAFLRGALLILDNADDPYDLSVAGKGGETGWFEQRLLDQYEKTYSNILLTIRDEMHRPLFAKPSMRAPPCIKLEVKTLDVTAGTDMLRHKLRPLQLAEAEEAQVISLCGKRGVSPLAVSVICGVIGYELAEEDELLDRTAFLRQLGDAMHGEGTDFDRLQSALAHSIRRVPAVDRSAFLKLHLFPDRFSLEQASYLWGFTEDTAKRILLRLKRASLVHHTRVEAEHPHEHHCPSLVTRPYVVLDHLWRFATRFAESPDSPWLDRAELADAIGRLCDLGKKAAKDRGLDISILYAAQDHARRCLAVKEGRGVSSFSSRHERSSDDDEDDAPNYRSLGDDDGDAPMIYRSLGSAAYSQRNYVPEMVPSLAVGSTYSVDSKRARETEAEGEGESSAAAYSAAVSKSSHAGLRKEQITGKLVESARGLLGFLDYLESVGD